MAEYKHHNVILSSNIESDDIPPPPYSSVVNEIIHEGMVLLHGMGYNIILILDL